MHDPALKRLISTKITTYRGHVASHFVVVIGGGMEMHRGEQNLPYLLNSQPPSSSHTSKLKVLLKMDELSHWIPKRSIKTRVRKTQRIA